MTSPLENLAGTGKPLAVEPTDAAEFEGLLRSGRARLVDARIVADLVTACETVADKLGGIRGAWNPVPVTLASPADGHRPVRLNTSVVEVL